MPLYTSYSEETQTQIEEFLENTFGWDEDELVGFIEIYGEEKFKLYFEDYADMVDDIGMYYNLTNICSLHRWKIIFLVVSKCDSKKLSSAIHKFCFVICFFIFYRYQWHRYHTMDSIRVQDFQKVSECTYFGMDT